MTWWRRLWNRREMEAQLDKELQFHLAERIADLRAGGIGEAEALRRARQEIGGPEQVKEACRDARGTRWLEDLAQDARYAMRTLRKAPAFAGFALLMLALGIGANTAIFSVLDGLLIRPLPFTSAGQLVWIANAVGDGPSGVTSQAFTFRDYRRLNRSFSEMAAYNAFYPSLSYNLSGAGDPERLVGVGVTETFFSLLGVSPETGRTFLPEECLRSGRRAAILSQHYWRTKFAGDPATVGTTLILNGSPVLVVGVMPASFDFASVFTPGARVDLFVPYYIDKENEDDGNELAILGRLKPNVTLAAAQHEANAILHELSRQRGYPMNAHLKLLSEHVRGQLRHSLMVLGGAVGFVLLIACANLSNLLLARAAARRKEIALRLAIGASRLRLVRQMLTESVMLSLCGGLLGLPLAFWGTRILANLRSTSIPMLSQVALDPRAFWFTLLLSTFTGVFFGVVPAWQAARWNMNDALKEGTPGAGGTPRNWMRSALVVGEIALSLMLLGGAGLMMKSLARLLDSDFGFRADHVAIVRVDPGPQLQERRKLAAFLDQVVASVREIPGIEAAGITDAVPLERDRSWGFGVVGRNFPPGQFPIAFVRVVGPGYLSAMRIPLLQGRTFDAHDGVDASRVVMINETTARRIFPGQNPLGRELWIGGKHRIVGVVRDVKHTALDQEAGMEMYLVYAQHEIESPDLVVRTSLEPELLASALRRKIWSFAPHQPLSEFRTMDQLLDSASSSRRFTMLLLDTFALLALLLAAAGIYGVIAYSVRQRTREMGIRMALGAAASQLAWQVVKEALRLSVAGVVLGLGGLLILSRYLAALLFEVPPTDPAIFGAVTLLLIGVAALAAYVPARQAARVAPVAALRTE